MWEEVWSRCIHPGVVSQLRHRGFSVLPSAVDPSLCRALKDEVLALHAANLLTPNHTHLVDGAQRRVFRKEGVFEFDSVHDGWDAAVAARAPTLAAMHADSSLATLLNLHLPDLERPLVRESTKAQVNKGRGGCFPLHFDSDPAVDARAVTALVYLTASSGHAVEGGALRLLPFPFPPVDVLPAPGTVVLFASQFTLHGVLPAHSRRLCITQWLATLRAGRRLVDAAGAGTSEPRRVGQGAWVGLLRDKATRKLLAQVAHQDEWKQSIRNAHADDNARAELIAAVERDVETIRRAVGHERVDEVLREVGHGLEQVPGEPLQWL